MLNKRPLTIAMPIGSFFPNMGGMEVGLHNIASRLKARGHRPILIIPATNYQYLKKNAIKLDYEVISYWPKMSSLGFKYPHLALWIYRIYYKIFSVFRQPDIWHATMAYPEGVALASASEPVLMRSAGADIQIDEGADYGFRRDQRIDMLVRRELPKLPAFVAITDSVSEEYLKLGILPEHIHSITNGVDLRRFEHHVASEDIRKKYGIAKDDFVFLSVGRNHPKKNYVTLISAVKELAKVNANFKVILVGAGVRALQEKIAEEGQKDRFVLIEQVGMGEQSFDVPGDGLLDFYKSADAFVFPSLIETFGIAIVEAMAAGLPCIVSDAPGCRNVIDHGAYALTFAPQDVESLTGHMVKIMADSSIRKEYGDKALLRARAYDWDAVVDAYEKLYYELIKGDGK